MGFNANTWSKDYTGLTGLGSLKAQDKSAAIEREEREAAAAKKAKAKK